MKKWFFSNNGEVTGPFDLDEAKDYLSSTPDVYGWHPSFTQWKPANCISEFVSVIPPTVQAPAIPKEISDKFLAKKQRLDTKLTSIDDSITHSQSSLTKLERQIEAYKELTINLNDDVKGAIDNIDRKHKSLSRKLSQVKDAVHIAEKEMSEVVSDFDRRMSSNDIFMPSCQQMPPAPQTPESKAAAEKEKLSKAKIAQEKLATPHKRVVRDAEVETPTEAESKASAASHKRVYRGNEVEDPIDQGPTKAEIKAEKKSDKESAASQVHDTYSGVKNIMKSVFRGDSKVEAKKESPATNDNKAKDEPLSMAERLKLAQNNH